MKEITGNLWDYYNKIDHFVCITTNGFLKNNGEAVMGRGCAKEAKNRFPEIPKILGDSIKKHGNIPIALNLGEGTAEILTFPVKHNWWEEADIALIERSALHLKVLALYWKSKTFILPRPGCGNGKLKWEDVKPVIEKILPDNVWVISW